ncbi:class I SAM-dependent methyltransferase [Oxalobacteraceae bacterium A2-2]
MDWTSGYASDIEYTAGFYVEQSPHHLNVVCALNGVEPLPLERGFDYCELGFGRGLTVNLLAASYPQGRFYAADFNPAHVAGARELAAAAELPNLTLLEHSFAELAAGAAGGLPQFDFITLHGIYTWVTAENRAHIAAFIARYLKPGGVAYVSYNAMPGWTSSLPLQRLLVEWGDAHPGRSDQQLAGAAAFVQELAGQNAAYFSQHPGCKPRLEGLQTHNRNYLVHEYMHRHWQPLYHADVARDLAGAKLEFAGSADLAGAYTRLYLDEAREALVQRLPDPAMRETLKDYFLNTSFRKDVFVRGLRRMAPLQRRQWLGQCVVVLVAAPEALSFKLKLSFGEVDAVPAIFDPVCTALSQRPHTVAELAALPALAGQPFENVVQTVALLSASGQGLLCPAGGDTVPAAAAQRMNRALAGRLRYADDYQALCSPLLGNCLGMSYVERLLYWLLAQHPGERDPQVLAAAGWEIMRSQDRRLLKDGQPIASPEENLASLRAQIGLLLRDKLPRWEQWRL